MKTKLMFVSLLAVVVACGLVFSGPVFGATKAAKNESKAQKSRGGGTDENIKSKSAENDPNVTPGAPPAKGGEKGRGAVCYLKVDNRTAWKIQIFVDGSYVGMVSSWGDASGYYNSGNRSFYAVADFTDGSKLSWGPRSQNCDGQYAWSLTP